MASKSNFISEFRQAVAQMLVSYKQALDLAEFCDDIGWTETELAGEFTSSDVTAAEFFAAKAIIQGMESANPGVAGPLSKMKA